MELTPMKIVQGLIILVVFFYTSYAMKCYQCNSAAGYANNTLCDNATMMQSTDCPVDGRNYTRCRKTIQWVLSDTRTVRSCATAGSFGYGQHCQDRIGTSNVKVRYCECTQDGCNGSSGISASSFVLAVVTAFTTIVSIAR